tara:strand:+ start:409 stop:573 length:165 start_codon:yes stop_codon:yes gene_type:complete
MEKGKLKKFLLEQKLFEENIFSSSYSDFFQNYLELLNLNGGKNIGNEFGIKDYS